VEDVLLRRKGDSLFHHLLREASELLGPVNTGSGFSQPIEDMLVMDYDSHIQQYSERRLMDRFDLFGAEQSDSRFGHETLKQE
jgi:hypothetical protein